MKSERATSAFGVAFLAANVGKDTFGVKQPVTEFSIQDLH